MQFYIPAKYRCNFSDRIFILVKWRSLEFVRTIFTSQNEIEMILTYKNSPNNKVMSAKDKNNVMCQPRYLNKHILEESMLELS